MKPETTETTPTDHLAQPAAANLPQQSKGFNARVATTLLLLLSSVSAGFLGGYFGGQSSDNLPGASSQAVRKVVASESELITQIARDSGPSVVSVNVVSDAVQNTFFGPQAVTQESAGTGFIISLEGIIVTNRHVVPKDAKQVSVTLADGTELDKVSVIGRTGDSDPLDVAFLKVNDRGGKELKAVKLGDSTKVEVGQKVIAIGNALGQFQNTVTSGIISGYGRSVEASGEAGGDSETLQNLFQTDASINQGNSGGPLVNIEGEVIGINTAVAGNGAENIGFAIPISDVQGLIKSVLKDGKLLRPYIGVRYINLTDDYAFQFSLDTKRGAYIPPASAGRPSIITDSPADKAGLQEKDIVVKINDLPIDEKNSLASVLGRFTVNDTVKLTIVRDGKELTKDVTLEAAPAN